LTGCSGPKVRGMQPSLAHIRRCSAQTAECVAPVPDSGPSTTALCRGWLRPNPARKTISQGCRWSGHVHGAGCRRMPEASQPVAGVWSGSATTGKLPPIWASGRDASRAVCSIHVARNFFWRAIPLQEELLAPLQDALRGGQNRWSGGVTQLDHRLQESRARKGSFCLRLYRTGI
jgi:hypothetical protein